MVLRFRSLRPIAALEDEAVLQKHRGLDGQVINPAEQPTDVDRRAMEHWSGMKDWIFCDGFGSGTTLIAALEWEVDRWH